MLIFLVLGTIMMGLATPTEAGAMGTIGAIVLAVVRNAPLTRFDKGMFIAGLRRRHRRRADRHVAFKSIPFKIAFTIMFASIIWLCWRAWQVKALRELIVQAFQATMRITAMVAFILVGATCFSITFQGVDGNRWVEHLMSNLPGGVWGFLIVVNLFVFFLAFFLDFFEIAFIIVPMLAPVAQKILTPVVGADAALIWFGVMLCVNVQTSFMHPPFGFALFYLRSVAPKEVKSTRHLLGLDPLGAAAAHHGGDRDRLPAVGDLLPRQAARHRSRARSRSRSRRRHRGRRAAGLQVAPVRAKKKPRR